MKLTKKERSEIISDAVGLLDEELVEEADLLRKQHKKKRGVRWAAIAACICLVLGGIGAGALLMDRDHPVQQWTTSFGAEDYFKYNKKKVDDAAVCQWVGPDPYTYTRDFSGQRKALEAEGAIPLMKNHPEFTCEVHYNKDKSVYNVEWKWSALDEEEDIYSHLEIMAAPEEITEPRIYAEQYDHSMDEEGNSVDHHATVTERDGIPITANGGTEGNKALTFQNSSGWYQVSGSWGDSIEDVKKLLDWVWEHPADFDRFPMEEGDNYVYSYFDNTMKKSPQIPEEFLPYIPDFKALGYEMEAIRYTHKNGDPYDFDGSYAKKSRPQITWCIHTELGYYEKEELLGRLEDLSLELIMRTMEREERLLFSWDKYYIRILASSDAKPEDVWSVIKSVRR
ncbi:MAG: hypothetical protein HFE76_05765 [Firmicutes bacterium]|nr:hypothetical protein [Bacillota bacterium]